MSEYFGLSRADIVPGGTADFQEAYMAAMNQPVRLAEAVAISAQEAHMILDPNAVDLEQ